MQVFWLQTRATAAWLAEKMSKDGHAVAVLTGDLTVQQRIDVLDRFRESKEKVLITTNVLSRGMFKSVKMFLKHLEMFSKV